MLAISPRLTLILLASVLTTLPATATETLKLSREDCDFITSYNQYHRDHDFPFLVGHMTHTAEWCPTGINCTLPLAKRTEDFLITVSGFDRMREAPRVYGSNVLYVMDFISEHSGLSVSPEFSDVDDNDSRIHIVFVDPSEPTIGLSADSERIEFFASRNDIPCLGLNFDWINRPSEYSEVLIKTDLEPKVLANCIKEEVYNVSGVPGDPVELESIFTPTPFSGEETAPPLFQAFSMREAIVMKLVYDPKMKIGQSRPETEEIANELIGSACR